MPTRIQQQCLAEHDNIKTAIDANNKSSECAMPTRLGLRVLSKMITTRWSELAPTAQCIKQNADAYSYKAAFKNDWKIKA